MIDFERVRRGARFVSLTTSERCLKALRGLIEDGITELLKPDCGRLRTHYLGLRRYSEFPLQREDYEYGMGPRHGHIVARLQLHRQPRTPEDVADVIYSLEAARDFGIQEVQHGLLDPTKRAFLNRTTLCTLLDLAHARNDLQDQSKKLQAAVDKLLKEIGVALSFPEHEYTERIKALLEQHRAQAQRSAELQDKEVK